MLLNKKSKQTIQLVQVGKFLGRKNSVGKDSRSAPPKFARIKPKKEASFEHGKICSNLNSEYVVPQTFRKSDYCSLGGSLSPSSQESGNKNYHSFHHPACNMELSALANYAAISRTVGDIEFDSDLNTPCKNVIISNSSEDVNTKDGEDADSQSSEAYEGQTDNQLATLEDIRALFSEFQEFPYNSVQVSNYNF